MAEIRWPKRMSKLVDDCTGCFWHVSDPWWREFKRVEEQAKLEDGEVLPGFECYENLFKSFKTAARPPTCSKTCQACFMQFRPTHWQKHIHTLRYEKTVSDADAAKQLILSRDEIRKNFATVRQLVEQYGDTLNKRWSKKASAKRRSILSAIMPEAYQRNDDTTSLSEMSCKTLHKFKQRLLLPWLNVECLSEDPNRLFSLIHHRTANTLSTWVMFDSYQLSGAFAQGALAVSYNPHCVVMCGEDNEEFGTLVPWDQVRAHKWETIGFPKAQLIMESQKALSIYLRQIVEAILSNDLAQAMKGNAQWTVLAATDFRSNDLSNQRRIVGFGSPPSFRLSEILDTFRTRLNAAKDEAWLLQTDPAFARDTLATAESSTVHKTGCNKIRSSMLLALMTDGIVRLRMMNEICEQVGITLEVFQQYHEQTSQGQYPSKCLESLRDLDCVLVSTFVKFVARARELALHLGIFDTHFNYGVCGCDIPVTTRKSSRDPVFLAMNALFGHNEEDKDPPGIYIGILQRYSDRLPQRMQEHVANMAAVDDAIMSLRYFRPSFAPPIRYLVTTAKPNTSKDHQSFFYSQHADESMEKHRDLLFESIKRFMACPTLEARVTKASLTAFDASRKALGVFWDSYRVLRMLLIEEKNCPREIQSAAMVCACYGLTKEYEDSMAYERRQLEAAIAEKESAAQKQKLLISKRCATPASSSTGAPYQTEWGTDTVQPSSKSANTKVQRKEKVKTRPSLPAVDSNEEEIQDVAEPANVPVNAEDPIVVGSETMDIINRMFVSHGKHMRSNVRWNVFVAAMEDAGMVARNDNGGSEVTFRDTKRGKGSVVFHMPHPDPKVNPICMRAFGKRLQRNLGWSYELFVERE